MVKSYVNGELVEKIRFPITKVGESSTIVMTVQNDTDGDNIELIPYTEDKEVTIVEYPRKLGIHEKGKVIWKFSPSKERNRSLDCEFGFKELIG